MTLGWVQIGHRREPVGAESAHERTGAFETLASVISSAGYRLRRANRVVEEFDGDIEFAVTDVEWR